MNGAHPILARLESGPATLSELAEACGYDADDLCKRNYVSVMVTRLRHRGHHIENLKRAGSHSGGTYRLLTGRRRCQMPSCITLLSSDNPSRYCRRHELIHVPDDALDLLICALEADCGCDVNADQLPLPLVTT